MTAPAQTKPRRLTRKQVEKVIAEYDLPGKVTAYLETLGELVWRRPEQLTSLARPSAVGYYGAPPVSAAERQRHDDEFAARVRSAIALGDAMREQMTGEMRGHACARLESVLAACVRHCGGLAAALRRMRRVDVRGDDGDAVELDGAEVWRGGWALDGTSLVWRETYAHGCPEDVSAGSQP